MNKIISTLFIVLSFLTFSREKQFDKGKESGIFTQVSVISDSLDLSIPEGKCIVFGKVYFEVEPEPYSSEFLICDKTHTAFYKNDNNKFKKINSDGTFEAIIDTSIQFFLFKDKLSETEISFLNEIYFENFKFQSQHKVEIAVYLPLKSKQYQITVDKPVIYAYSEKALDFILNLKPQGELTFTYPKLSADNSWIMKTGENGNLIAENGAEFPYLFWEAKQDASSLDLTKTSSNEIVAGKDLVSYCEKELTKLGFNAKEKTDFITYWCPKFIESKMVQVQFFVDDNCSVIGELNISPKPNNLRRIYVLFKSNPIIFPNVISIPLNVKPFDRNGFTVLEWGGSEIKSLEANEL